MLYFRLKNGNVETSNGEYRPNVQAKQQRLLLDPVTMQMAPARFDLSEDFFRSLGELHSESIDVTGKTTKTTFNSRKYPKCDARLVEGQFVEQ